MTLVYDDRGHIIYTQVCAELLNINNLSLNIAFLLLTWTAFFPGCSSQILHSH